MKMENVITFGKTNSIKRRNMIHYKMILGWVFGFIHVTITALFFYFPLMFFVGIDRANRFMDDIVLNWMNLKNK